MTKYGQAAKQAAQMLTTLQDLSPQEAWRRATAQVFGEGTSSQEKSCPMSAFLGLCEAGLVEGVPEGDYTRSSKNKAYALEAVSILRENPRLADHPLDLWAQVPKDDPHKSHNSQMEVVCALWTAGVLA